MEMNGSNQNTKYEEIQRLKNNKSPGTVNIPAELQKHGGGKLEQWLYDIVRTVRINEELPDKWKEGIICPVHKKGNQWYVPIIVASHY
jgi:hypothetical protein